MKRIRPLRATLLAELAVVSAALLAAWVVARPCAGSWNDGSRLAAVESLVDRHTWAIDDSIFVRVPRDLPQPPYPARSPFLLEKGTLDKLWIDGHFYSDKTPVPALLLAGVYAGWQAMTGWTARSHPAAFCSSMTVASSGLAFAVAVWCALRLGRVLRLRGGWRLLPAGGLALSGVALAYTSHVNNHVLLLAVTMAAMVQLAWMTRPLERTVGRYLALGCCAGLGYAIDLGAGPGILGAVLLYAGWRGVRASQTRGPGDQETRRGVCLLVSWSPGLLVFGGALPWLALHHGLNYALAGTWGPANANPAFFRWPGCPFSPDDLTGGLCHPDPYTFVGYALDLLFGGRGILTCNLPLLLALPGVVLLWRGRPALRPELLAVSALCVAVWLAYSLCSTNHAGECCSVRWFVPLLAPGWLVLALLLREAPWCRRQLLVLCGWGAVLGVHFACRGAWMNRLLPEFWPVLGLALASWAWCWSSDVRLEQTVQQAVDRLRDVVGLRVQRDAQREGQRVAQSGADQLPGPHARVEVAAEDAGLLPLGDDPGQQGLAVQVERPQHGDDLLVVALHQRAVQDLVLQGPLARRAQVAVHDGLQPGQRVGQGGHLALPAVQRRLPNLLQHFQE
jgi:hypothetical protein